MYENKKALRCLLIASGIISTTLLVLTNQLWSKGITVSVMTRLMG